MKKMIKFHMMMKKNSKMKKMELKIKKRKKSKRNRMRRDDIEKKWKEFKNS